ncbi:DUF1653 domain-containing protein [Celerinatantimonas sp. YJH-8]|uniref:DUF1653 domain-containing protein n=1 Tax=Celerinatantimonas sp. YJH-8 TaxID=3228714 RepID=UPI0038BEA387
MTVPSDDEKSNSIPVPGLYQHFKGNLYEVLDVVHHSETEELLVLYRPCYGQRQLWVRPLALFNQPATTADGECPRFSLIRKTESSLSQPSDI